MCGSFSDALGLRSKTTHDTLPARTAAAASAGREREHQQNVPVFDREERTARVGSNVHSCVLARVRVTVRDKHVVEADLVLPAKRQRSPRPATPNVKRATPKRERVCPSLGNVFVFWDFNFSKMKWPQFVQPVARPGLTGSMEEGDEDAANANEVKFEPGKGKGIQVPPAKKGFINLAAFGIQVGALEGVFAPR
jgi:hypothetical protein